MGIMEVDYIAVLLMAIILIIGEGIGENENFLFLFSCIFILGMFFNYRGTNKPFPKAITGRAEYLFGEPSQYFIKESKFN